MNYTRLEKTNAVWFLLYAKFRFQCVCVCVMGISHKLRKGTMGEEGIFQGKINIIEYCKEMKEKLG